MPAIKTFIDIGASPEAVWRVLTDFAAYPKWNPIIREIAGGSREKTTVKMRMHLPRGGVRKLKVVVTRAIPAAELRWRGKRLIQGIFDREQTFIIVPHGLKGVRLIQRGQFSGFLAPLIMPFIANKTTAAYEAMNKALKKFAEAKH